MEHIGINLVSLHQSMTDSASKFVQKSEDCSSQTQQWKPPLCRKTSPCIVITSAADDSLSNSQTSNTTSDTSTSTTTQTPALSGYNSATIADKQIASSNKRLLDLSTQFSNVSCGMAARSAVNYST